MTIEAQVDFSRFKHGKCFELICYCLSVWAFHEDNIEHLYSFLNGKNLTFQVGETNNGL